VLSDKTYQEVIMAKTTSNSTAPVQAAITNEPNLEMISSTLKGVQEQIRFADAKASFIAAMNVLLFGFIASQADRLSSVPNTARHVWFWFALVFLILYAVAAFFSVGHVIYAVMPRFGELAPQCKTHFAHVLRNYGKDHGRYCTDVKAMTNCDWANDLASQVVEVCHIADIKHRLIRKASIWTIISLLLWIGALVIVTFGR
jgi:hypothetical protein